MEWKWMSKWFGNHYADSSKIQIRNDVGKKFQKWMIKFLLGRQIKVKTWLLTFECLKFQNFKIENWKVNFNLAEFFAAYAVYG